jgi:hypothetical protein
MATWESQFAHLGMAADGGGGWRRRDGSVQARRRWRWAPGLLRLNRGYQRGRRSSLILPGWAVAHRRGVELNTVARVSIFVGQNLS